MLKRILAVAAIAAFATLPASAETRVTLKSANAGSSYYMMTVQLAETLKEATGGEIEATVEESQGSVQNVKAAPRRGAGYVFTSPPSLVRQAQKAEKPFEGETGYDTIRTLFVMPSVTMHFVVRGDAGISKLEDLAGKTFVPGGRGTFTERQSRAVFKLLGIEDKVKTREIELSGAVAAMRNNQIDGFATGSSHPTSHVTELASSMSIKLLSLTDAQVAAITAADPSVTRVVIAKGTYPNQTEDVQTVAIPVGAYTTSATDEETAYKITKSFWQRKAEMSEKNPWWAGVAPSDIASIGIKLHPGAARYYAEAGIAVPDAMK
jgi:TRAP transporter TAXI family solute receptor